MKAEQRLTRWLKLGGVVAVLLLPGCRQDEPFTGAAVVCLGDSLTVCGGPGGRYTDWLGEFLPDVMIINEGISGDTLAGGRQRFSRDVLQHAPAVVVIELGANDFWRHERTIDELQADLVDMITRARQAGIEVVVASCFGRPEGDQPRRADVDEELAAFGVEIGRMERRVCERYTCFYVPDMQADIRGDRVRYWADKNHPNRAGNRFVAQRILPTVRQALARAARR